MYLCNRLLIPGLCFLSALNGLGFQCWSQSTTTEQPNIVLINLDDASSDMFSSEILDAFYPNIASMAQNGIRFSNVHATTPFCAPSRASLFRGQYAFNTGIKVNNPNSNNSNGFTGGYAEFIARGYRENELGFGCKTQVIEHFMLANFTMLNLMAKNHQAGTRSEFQLAINIEVDKGLSAETTWQAITS